MFTGEYLRGLRQLAIRRRVYNRLGCLDRGILYLSGRLVERVSSPGLVSQLVEIVRKLETLLMGRLERHTESFGVARLLDVVGLALGFGSVVARGWSVDLGFARYLAFMDLNR